MTRINTKTEQKQKKKPEFSGRYVDRMHFQALMESKAFKKRPALAWNVNRYGDLWCRHSNNRECYHYENFNGSVFYKNPDNSSYYWDPRGFSRYIDPVGRRFVVWGPRLDVAPSRLCFSCNHNESDNEDSDESDNEGSEDSDRD